MQVFKADDNSQAAVADICFTPDGRELVTSTSISVTVWNVMGMPTARQSTLRKYQAAGPVAVSPCGRFLVFWQDRRLQVFDLTESRRQPVAELDGYWAHQIAFSPDGNELAVPEFTPRQWAVPSWKLTSASAGPWRDLVSPAAQGRLPTHRTVAPSRVHSPCDTTTAPANPTRTSDSSPVARSN